MTDRKPKQFERVYSRYYGVGGEISSIIANKSESIEGDKPGGKTGFKSVMVSYDDNAYSDHMPDAEDFRPDQLIWNEEKKYWEIP
jgi:hypothetical protein